MPSQNDRQNGGKVLVEKVFLALYATRSTVSVAPAVMQNKIRESQQIILTLQRLVRARKLAKVVGPKAGIKPNDLASREE